MPLLLSEPQDSGCLWLGASGAAARQIALAARKTLGIPATDQERGGQPKSVTAHQSTDKDGQKIAQE